MDGLGRATGAGTSIELDGETYLIEGLGLKDFGEVEQVMLRETTPLKIIETIPEGLSQEVKDRIVDRAIEDAKKHMSIDPDDLMKWINTPRGFVYTIWICMRERYPDKFGTLEKCMEILDSQLGKSTSKEFAEKFGEIKEARDQASGIDEAGN